MRPLHEGARIVDAMEKGAAAETASLRAIAYGGGKMPLLDHLIELRSRLLKSLLAIALAFGVCFYFARPIFAAFAVPDVTTKEIDVAEAVWVAANDASPRLRYPAGADAVALAAQNPLFADTEGAHAIVL